MKANESNDQRAPSMILPGGRFTATNNTVRALILNAYDIEAKAAADSIPAGARGTVLWDKTRLMLRTLLADRFKLSVRRERKEMSAYQMVALKTGAKLQKSDQDCSSSAIACHGFSGSPRQLTGKGVDTSDVALMLSSFLDRPVVDRTGIEGIFDIKLQWNPFAARPQPVADPPSREGPKPDLACRMSSMRWSSRLG